LPLAPIGGEFRQNVWNILCEIPYGEVITYGDIAKKIAAKMDKKSMSSQAVGGAVGHNPISVIIPCHRVVGANGSLTGYAGGLAVKKKLLELEGAPIAKQIFTESLP
jgi:methylated-DNA-[protein]-cysteine S-methyltransferase